VIDNASGVDTISTTFNIPFDGNFDIPKRINFHIYAISDSEEPRYSAFPEGMVEPRIKGSTLSLSLRNKELNGYSRGDSVQSGVNLYIPLSQLRNVKVGGVDQFVEIIANDEGLLDGSFPRLTLRSSGVDTQIYVNAPFSPIDLVASGVDNSLVIVAAKNSNVDMSGVDQKVQIKSGLLSQVKLSGVDQYLFLEGEYEQAIRMSGVDVSLRVNGESGCNNIDNSGVDNNCRTTSDMVSVPQLACLADTKVTSGTSTMSTGAAIGLSFAILVLLAGGIALCVFCCGCCRGKRRAPACPATDYQSGEKKPATTVAPGMDEGPAAVAAEVVEVKEDPEQPLSGDVVAKPY
jgi:hypothetical protein